MGRRKEEGGRERFPFLALVYLTQPILHIAPVYVASPDFAERLRARRKKYRSLAVIDHLEFKSTESDRSGQAPNCDSLDADEECVCEARV